ncbi:MAG: hypothetical protein RRY76_00155 [Clostridia bacterium]
MNTSKEFDNLNAALFAAKKGIIMNLTEKSAYLKGLMDGMKFNTETDEGKIIKAIAELLEGVTLSISDLEEETKRINDYVEELDEDLAGVEDELYGDDECDCGCGDCDDDDDDSWSWDNDEECHCGDCCEDKTDVKPDDKLKF